VLYLHVTMEGSTSRAALKYQAFRLNWQIKRMKACQDDSAAILDTQKLEIKRAERSMTNDDDRSGHSRLET